MGGSVSLSELDVDVLRVCAVEDWTSEAGQSAWRTLYQRHGWRVNDAPVRAHLCRLGLVDRSDRLTLLGKAELLHHDIGNLQEAS